MRQLTSLDAQFLAVENDRNFGHVGSLCVCDPSTAPGEDWGLADVCRMIESRLHLLPPFRWKLASVPFGLDLPYWVQDPHFDLDFHVRESAVPPPGGERQLAETVARIEELIAYWRTGFDWRAVERRLNALPQYRAVVDGVGLHFLHRPGAGPSPLPLLLANGWPSSFVEYLPVIDRLADPGAYGGDPRDAFSVVAPALPGYGFSDPCDDRWLDRVVIAGQQRLDRGPVR